MKHLFFALGVFLAVAAGAQDPSLVLADGGLQFPDGTVQSTAAAKGFAPVEDTGQKFCWDQDGKHYWSSATFASSTGTAWGVYLDDGDVDGDSKSSGHEMWPVRGGQ